MIHVPTAVHDREFGFVWSEAAVPVLVIIILTALQHLDIGVLRWESALPGQ